MLRPRALRLRAPVARPLSRELQHRIKSVGMSTFKQEEVDALDQGGNAVAQRVYCATWTAHDFPVRRSSAAARAGGMAGAWCGRDAQPWRLPPPLLALA